jgi:NADPH:quinone reductase-like Zn-dependent oxidoreductase
MRAVLIDRYGGPDVMRIAEVPVPVPGDDQVLVAVAASSVNGGDVRIRSGEVSLVTGRRFPQGLGQDVVGTVVAVGRGVTRWQPGDRVWAVHAESLRGPARARGAYAEYAVLAADALGRAPSGVDPVDAAALPVVGTTALFAVDAVARVRAGERVLVRGASGGVGVALTQLLTARGAEVTALVGSAGTTPAAAGVRVLPHREHPLASLPSFDVVLDTVGSELLRLRRLTAPAGRVVTITLSPVLRAGAELLVSQLFGRRRIRFSRNVPSTADMDGLRTAVEEGTIRPVVQRVFSLDQIVEAHHEAEAGGALGKRVITMTTAA